MMNFTEEEVEKMKAIFNRLEPRTLYSMQYFTKENTYRTGCTLVIYNKGKKPICIFQNFEKLSAFRMKLLMRLSEEITHPIYITYPGNDIMRIGWKIESQDLI